MLRTLVLWLVLFLPLSSSTAAQNGDNPIVASDMLSIVQLGDVVLSPDGRNLVYTARTIVEDDDGDAYRYDNQLWLASAGGGTAPRQLTFAPEGASNPAWHPDGDELVFVRTTDSGPQLFVLSLLGGEPRQITSFEFGTASPQWSPNGDRIVFQASVPEQKARERYGNPPWMQDLGAPSDGTVMPSPDGSPDAVRAWLAENSRNGNVSVINRLDFQGERGLSPNLELQHYYVIEQDESGGWSAPRTVTGDWGSYAAATWHPDGDRLLLQGWQNPHIHPDLERRSHIYIAYADQDTPRRLFSIDGYQVGAPQASSDGRTVAFLAQDASDPGYAQTELGVFPIDNPSAHRFLTADFDRSVQRARWSPDDWHIYFTAASEGGFPLYRTRVFEDDRPAPLDAVDVDTLEADTIGAGTLTADLDPLEIDDPDASQTSNEIVPLTPLDGGVRDFDVSRASIFYVYTEAANPYELYAASAPFESARRLTDHNASWLVDKRLSTPEHHTVVNDGMAIDYWVMRPPSETASTPHPMMLQIHGGPAAMWGPGEASMWHEFQYFAARGYAVVYSNPRGSSGYGRDFQRGNFQDWGSGPADDVLAVATAAAELPFVDETRQVVTGGSYGGYLTAWILTQDDRFRAAVVQRGVYDLSTFLGEGNAWRLVPSHFGGYPWEGDISEFEGEDPWRPALIAAASESDTLEALLPMPADSEDDSPDADDDPHAFRFMGMDGDDAATVAALSFRERLIRNSPLTYVREIETPLLIMHGDNDLRTGVSQSEMLYRSLRLLNRPVEYVRYTGADHELSRSGDPTLRLDRLVRMHEFLRRHVE